MQSAVSQVFNLPNVAREQRSADYKSAIRQTYRYYAPPGVFLVVRTAMAPQAFARTLQKTVLRLDPELPVDDLRPMQARIDESLIPRRMTNSK